MHLSTSIHMGTHAVTQGERVERYETTNGRMYGAVWCGASRCVGAVVLTHTHTHTAINAVFIGAALGRERERERQRGRGGTRAKGENATRSQPCAASPPHRLLNRWLWCVSVIGVGVCPWWRSRSAISHIPVTLTSSVRSSEKNDRQLSTPSRSCQNYQCILDHKFCFLVKRFYFNFQSSSIIDVKSVKYEVAVLRKNYLFLMAKHVFRDAVSLFMLMSWDHE